VVGNIGIPYTEHVLDSDKDSVTVGEISSFQLETILDFHPRVSAILNITPDHLNRHHTMENYIAAKNAITKNQTIGFLDDWNRNRDHKQCIYISYDLSNKNCQAGDIDLIEYGKAKDDNLNFLNN
jgi:UDP-N-acetylmuramoylalanine-D-glutamate ligase